MGRDKGISQIAFATQNALGFQHPLFRKGISLSEWQCVEDGYLACIQMKCIRSGMHESIFGLVLQIEQIIGPDRNATKNKA